MPQALKVVTEVEVIVDLPIERQPDCAILVADRLRSTGDINNAQTTMQQEAEILISLWNIIQVAPKNWVAVQRQGQNTLPIWSSVLKRFQ